MSYIKMDYDKIIVNIFISNTGRSKKSKLNRLDNYPNIKNYLINRFTDYSSSFKEILDRIKFGIEKRPVCKECGSIVKYKGLINGYPTYKDFCSCKCAQNSSFTRNKYVNTCIVKYGVENSLKSKEINQKRILTLFSNYNVTVPSKSEEIKEKIRITCENKYGCDSPLQNKEIRKKIENTNILRYGHKTPLANKEYMKYKLTYLYGVEYATQIPYVKEKISEGTSSINCRKKKEKTCLERYGVPHISMNEEIKNKKIETRRKHNTFNTSKPEEELFLYIKDKFPTVIRQYNKDKRYLFDCDFYIPELDYFIELNGFCSHGDHPFNSNNEDDIDKLNTWKLKSKNHPMYKNMIKVWTIKDPEKRECARRNNLNFKEVWSLEEGKEFIDNLYNMMES